MTRWEPDMKLDHLGDSLDHWKGSMVELTRPILRDLRVVPMFTDVVCQGDPWTEQHLLVYAKLLRIATNHLLMTDRCFTHSSRQTYFSNPDLRGKFDIFVDPDTGLEPARGCDDRHITFNDVDMLLRDAADRMLMIYQHSQPYNMRDSVVNRMPAVRRRWPACAYWAGAASMIFVSRDEDRIAEVRRNLSQWLGPCAGGQNGCPERLLAGAVAGAVQ